jgi:trehalose synthase-fused probable maltokinase
MRESSPVLRVASARAALAKETLSSIPTDALVRWLKRRRWFGAKGDETNRIDIARVIEMPWEDGHWAIAELVSHGDLGSAHWQLPLGVGIDAAQYVQGDEDDDTAIAPIAILDIAGEPGQGVLYDATHDARFLRHLVDVFAPSAGEAGHYGSTIESRGERWIAESLGHEAFIVPADARARVASGEQSNTSILIGELAILKLFRRLEAGEHPDVEVTRFLTLDAGFPNTPTLLGVIRLESSNTEPTIAGMLQEFLPNSIDAWKWTLEQGREYFDRPEAVRGAGAPPRQQDALEAGEPRNQKTAPTSASAPTLENRYRAAAERLGVITRAMHEAFASDAAKTLPAFAPELVTREELTRWTERVSAQVSEAIALLDRQLQSGGVPSPHVAQAGEIVERRRTFQTLVRRIASEVKDPGCLIRHHGDYHLGQVLRTAGDDFMVIDFEGEPTRPLADRRRKHSALRDVAGMLRSFAYAAATLATNAGAADARSERWEDDARESFLHGYGRTPVRTVAGAREHEASGSGFLPKDPADVKRLIMLFEMEKVFYELAYELNNRPGWLWIPLHGIAKVSA